MIVAGVLYGGVSGEKLRGEVGFGNGGVRARKRVSAVTERARPDAGSVVDAGVGVQNGAAFGADERVVGEDWDFGGLH